MTSDQLHILQHSLGVDQYGRGSIYRHHYVGDPESFRPLVELGYMVEYPPSDLTGGDPLFIVTEAGKEAVRRESPAPPKLTRSQQRYRRFLDADSGMTFNEWLKYDRRRPRTEEDVHPSTRGLFLNPPNRNKGIPS